MIKEISLTEFIIVIANTIKEGGNDSATELMNSGGWDYKPFSKDVQKCIEPYCDAVDALVNAITFTKVISAVQLRDTHRINGKAIGVVTVLGDTIPEEVEVLYVDGSQETYLPDEGVLVSIK